MTSAMLSKLYAQKTWANRELFDVLAGVDSTQHASTLETATRTLNHIYIVDRIFRAHLIGEAHRYTATNTPETPDLGELHFNVTETDLWFEQFVASASEQALQEKIGFTFTDGDTGTMTREEILFHVLSHGSYHRGNVGQVLKGIAVAPPRDLLTKFLHVQEPERRQLG